MVSQKTPVIPSRSPGFVPRRPVFAVAAFLTAGAACSIVVPANPAAYLLATIVILVAAGCSHARPLISSTCLAACVFLIGIALGQQEYYRYPPGDIGLFASDRSKLVTVELRVESPPRITLPPPVGGKPPAPRQVFSASILRIKTHAGWVMVTGTMLVQLEHPHSLLAEGQTLSVLGMLSRPSPAMNPGQFDWAEYYREQRMLATMLVPRAGNVQILSDPGPGFLGWIRESARHLLAMGFPAKRALDHAVLAALVLGDLDPAVRDTHDAFAQIGTAYQLSVSGMHLAVIAGFVYLLCRLTLRSPRFSCTICLVAVLLYALIATPAMPIVRSTLICAALLSGVLINRSGDKLNFLGIAAIVLVLLHPLDLRGPGFQLGFITVLGLIFIGRPIFRALTERDILRETERPTPSAGFSVVWQSCYRAVRLWIVLSVIAWLTSLPLVAYHFGQINPWSIPAGLLMFPVVATALLGGCGKIVFTLGWPSLAMLWARGAACPALAMRRFAELLAHLPGAGLPVAQPSVWVIVLYYFVLMLPLLPWKSGRLRLALRLAPALAAIVFLVSLSSDVVPHSSRDELTVTLLDIGAGQTAVVEAPDAEPCLIDAGSSTVSDVNRTVLAPFLRYQGWNTIDLALLSHSDYDHISAISSAASQFGIRQVYTSDYFRGFAMGDPPAQAMLNRLAQLGKPPKIVRRGDHVSLSTDAAVDVLWPPDHCTFNVNNTGVVLRLTFRGKRILFPADIQIDAMRELLKTPAELKADVLVAAHHGSSENNTAAFVEAVDPAFVVSSNGTLLTGKQKRFEKLIGNRPLYHTSDWGAVTIYIARDGKVWLDTFLRKKR